MSISLSKVDTNMSDLSFTSRVSGVLRQAFSSHRNATKIIAQRIGRDPRAVKAWLCGECAPSLNAALSLAAECDDLADEINRIIQERRAKCQP